MKTLKTSSFRIDLSMRLNLCRIVATIAIAVVTINMGSQAAVSKEPLPSWRESQSKRSILEFVRDITDTKHADYRSPAERIAVFDNDGTLWTEQPIYSQALFLMDRIKTLAPQNPEWKTTEPFASLLRGDLHGVERTGEVGIAQLIAATHSGLSVEDFENLVLNWIEEAKHPSTQSPLRYAVYQPMLELMDYLRENEFDVFIVTGGGEDFVRPWSEKYYGVPKRNVIGSTGPTSLKWLDGVPTLWKQPGITHVNDREGKPVGIYRKIGVKPIFGFGNSDGDLEMLQWISSQNQRTLCALVQHTDDEREVAYDRDSTIGKLDKALDEASARQWEIVDMKADWAVIWPSSN